VFAKQPKLFCGPSSSVMVTVCKAFNIGDNCFCADNDDGTTSYGCCFCTSNQLCCTTNKQIVSEAGSYDVVIPPVEELMCRSACLCCYWGFGCKPSNKPLGITREGTCICCQMQGGCQLITAETKKRACYNMTMLGQILSCEEQASSEFIVEECSNIGMCFCCLEGGLASKTSCCPTPLTCCGEQGQCCCFFSRGSFPCNDTTPCELGCCGIFCINKFETIKDAEEAQREAARFSEAVDAVIVEKGAPSIAVTDEEMVRQ